MEKSPPPKAAWRRALNLFDEYVALEGQEFDEKLARLDHTDPESAACLRSLLENDRTGESILGQPVAKMIGDLLPEEKAEGDATGQIVGNYRLLRRIGQGGMGVVYEAERSDGEFEQRVAVKLLRWGPAAEGADARFARERRILARLEHPGIARLLDGGKSSEGWPYLVMELVEGVPIDEYCDARRLSIEDRLGLFVDICHVVHYAHRQLVVHRDLKPSNILVDDQGRIRLLDFGIAKLLAEEEDEGLTRIGQRVMTPDFAAPEQIEGGQITTATDVWTLGLILHELLTGRRPDPAKSGLVDSAPQRPSSGVSSRRSGADSTEELSELASSRGLSPSKLRRRLRGDLDLIILQALRRRPEERYDSANVLADDIQRHLDGFPVAAQNESLILRSRAFLRRNRGAVAAVLAVIIAIAGGFFSTLQQARERGQQAQIAEGVLDFLVELFAGSDPSQSLGNEPTALELLDRGAEQLESDTQGSSEIRPHLMREIGRVYFHLGRYQRAAHFAGRSLLQSQERYGWDSPETSGSESLWGICMWRLGHFREAETSLQHALKIQMASADDPAASETLSALGALYSSLGRHSEAEGIHRQALEISRKNSGADSAETATNLQNIATVLWRQERLSEAESFARQSLTMRLAITGADSVATASSLQCLGSILRDQEKIEEAEDCFRRAVTLREQIYHGVHPDLAQSLSGLSEVLMKAGRQQESLELAERSVQINREVYGPDHADLAVQLNNLGKRFYQLGEYQKAEDSLRKALDIWQRTLPPEHSNITIALSNIGMIMMAEGKLSEAEALMRKSIDHEQQKDQPLYGRLCLSLCNLGRILDAQGRMAEAIASLEDSQRLAQENLDPQDSLLITIDRHLSTIRGDSE